MATITNQNPYSFTPDAAGTFTITVNAVGATEPKTVSLEVKEKYTLTVEQSATTVYVGESVTFTAKNGTTVIPAADVTWEVIQP